MQQEAGDASRFLREREKELDALYRLAALFTRSEQDNGRVLSETADIPRRSIQFPSQAVVSIESEGLRQGRAPMFRLCPRRTLKEILLCFLLETGGR